MTASAVFAKTTRGQDELVNRSGTLTPRQRRILIFIDGKHSVADLRQLVAADDLTHTLGMLEEEGFIELSGLKSADGQVAPDTGPLPSITAFRALPTELDPQKLDMARNYMLNTIKMFCGNYTHITLQSDIAEAADHAALREHFDAWYRVIIDTRDGKRRAEELRANLLKVI